MVDLTRAYGLADGFIHLTGIVNVVTGTLVPCDFEIHTDDLDWCLELWGQRHWLDFQLNQAELASGSLPETGIGEGH